MTAMIGLRLGAYLRAYHAVAPMIAGLVVLSILYGGGRARPEEAYGVSAVVLFPVLAWQVKILLDAEPDVQRRLMRVAAGSWHREVAAGLFAGAVAGLPTIALGLALPWLLAGVTTAPVEGQPPPLGVGAALALGVWAHLLALLAAVGFGAWASRAVSRSAGTAVSLLAGGTVAAIVLGLRFSPVPWLVPPLMPTARAIADETITIAAGLGLTAWAAGWSGVVLAGYWALRRRRV